MAQAWCHVNIMSMDKSDSHPTVSVVIPAYNAGAVLARAVDSVFAQSTPVTEIIVVNDGSTDDTALVMNQYGSRIRGFTTPNRGAAAARNEGIERANSEWIAFLDADDAWHVDKMARQWETLAKNPQAILCYAPMQNVNAQGQRELIWPDLICESERDNRLLTHWACLAEMPPTPTVLVQRTTLLSAGMFPVDLTTAEDLDLWVRLLAIGKFVGVTQVLADRFLSGTSLTATHSQVAQYGRYFQVLKKRRREIRQWLGNHRVSGEAYLHTCLANVHARSENRWGQLYHAVHGVLGKHAQRSLAMKLLLEAFLGTAWYQRLVRFWNRGDKHTTAATNTSSL
jgi:glycosyltransferase involved in cell wall biosynthesis